jgi:hypothetical protein
MGWKFGPLAIFAAILAATPSLAAPTQKPNIVYIVSDD